MSGNRKDTTQAIMEGVLKFIAAGGFVTTALVVPNALQIFEKPMNEMLKSLDRRAQEREVRRVLHYMKQRGLIRYQTKDYENGIKLTKEGKKRLKRHSFESMVIASPSDWDKKWRLVFFDIPEDLHTKRAALTHKLRILGFQQLQQSIWIHPFPSRPEIEAITEVFDVRRFVTYIEISHIDGDKQLRNRFKRLIAS